MIIEYVIKSTGERENFDPNKLNRWAEWASEHDNWSEIALQAVKKCYNGCTTKELQKAMIDACVDREDEKYLRMAARLLIGSIYKEVYGGFSKLPKFKTQYQYYIDNSIWEDLSYTDKEIEAIDEIIDHDKDLTYTYSELKQFMDKYSTRNIANGIIYESPQMMYIGMAMAACRFQPENRKLEDIKKLYNYLSDRKINAPTPYLNGLRTKAKGYASCCVIKGDDSAPSLGVAEHIAYTMTYKKAGIGIFLDTRSINEPIRDGVIVHNGKLPYYRCIDAAVKANTQETRGGSATMHYNVLDPQIEDLLALKNITTPDQKRINFLDYSVGVNKIFAKKVAKNEEWCLVSSLIAPKLHDLFYSADTEKFEQELENVINDNSIKYKKIVKARDILKKLLRERVETGRIYIHWLDELNRHTPFKDKIYSSNLCQEIALPTQGFETMRELYGDEKTNGEVALCFLSAIVAGRVAEEEYEDVAYYTLLMIDNIIDIMEYPFITMEETSKSRRSVGIGITNLAYDMAKKDLKYDSIEGKNYIHRLSELHSYSLHKASLKLAKERGICNWIDKTKYPQGWLPIDSYNKEVDKIHSQELLQDWETLRKEIIANGGIRHSVLEAHMPCESSSLASNTTNGLYPIRDYMISKKSQKGKILFIVPEYNSIKNNYQIAWDIDNKDLIEVYAIVQKFTSQAISADFYLDYSKLEEGMVSDRQLTQNFLHATKLGLKTHYYLNSRVSIGSNLIETIQENGCENGACSL